MRAKNDAWFSEQRRVARGRLGLKRVQTGAMKVLRFHRSQQSGFIDHPTTTGVDDDRAFRQQRKFVCAQYTSSFFGERGMKRNHIRLAEPGFERSNNTDIGR